MTDVGAVSDPTALAQAQQRAMPTTRLLDCGMDPADARMLFTRTTSGESWDGVAESLANVQITRGNAEATHGNRATAAAAHRH